MSSANKPLIFSRAFTTAAIVSVLATGCTQKLKSDTGIEATNLVSAYTQLQQAIKNQDFKTAYSLMSTNYKIVHQFNTFEAGHKTVLNHYAPFSSNSIVKVTGNKGEIMITIHVQEEYWNVYSFEKEGHAWRCTGNERILTIGWD